MAERDTSIQAGTLTRRIKVLTPVVVTGDYGDTRTAYTDTYETRAQLTRGKGSTAVVADAVVYNYAVRWYMRHYVPVSDYCVIYDDDDGAYYLVDSVLKYSDRIEVDAHKINASLVTIAND